MSKNMIPTSSDKYIRRMVRELNSLPDGFYLRGDLAQTNENPRCRRAKRTAQGSMGVTGPRGTFTVLASFVEEAFSDCNGRRVYASRQP